MGWRGSGGGGAATIGVFYFFGGMLQIIGSVMEWIIGNTFPCVVFGSYGAFWLALAATLQPVYNAEGAFTSGKSGAEAAAGQAEFLSSFGQCSNMRECLRDKKLMSRQRFSFCSSEY